MIVTITAYKRPHLLARCLESVCAADLSPVSGINVSLDYHSPEMTGVMRAVCDKFRPKLGSMLTIFPYVVKRLGVANHPRVLFDMLTEELDQQTDICAIEEDTIVSPDAFMLADWGLKQIGYDFVNLADYKRSGLFNNLVHEDWELRSPYGWAFTTKLWNWLEPQWNGKIRAPYGWDWQVSHLCYREGWRCLTPDIARVYNTGREEGTYDTPENWDETQKDVLICQDVPNNIGKYVVVSHDRPARAQWPEWVLREVAP